MPKTTWNRRPVSCLELRRYFLKLDRLLKYAFAPPKEGYRPLTCDLQRLTGSGGRKAAACANFRGAQFRGATNFFMFCPVAISSASMFTFSNLLSLNLRRPCQSFASPNNGSTHTLRFRRAFS
jgi:hypothetical protein